MSRPTRRTALAAAAVLASGALPPVPVRAQAPAGPADGADDAHWLALARQMRALAESWGDQSYGAVLVMDGRAVGLGPSRVVRDRDPDAHAERVAIRAAQQALGRTVLSGAVLYGTSRACALCEAAAARAGVARMVHGPTPTDAGPPRLREP